jgi:hypothetical protein
VKQILPRPLGLAVVFAGNLTLFSAKQAEIRGNGLFAAIPRLRVALRRL